MIDTVIDAVIDWLLGAELAIRWQVRRDPTDVPSDVIAAERARGSGGMSRVFCGTDPISLGEEVGIHEQSIVQRRPC